MMTARRRRPEIVTADGMINAVLNVVTHADDADRASAVRWAERRLARSSLPRDVAAAALLEAAARRDWGAR